MADILLLKESREIIKQMGAEEGSDLLCPVLKILQMRHSNLNVQQAKDVVLRVLKV